MKCNKTDFPMNATGHMTEKLALFFFIYFIGVICLFSINIWIGVHFLASRDVFPGS